MLRQMVRYSRDMNRLALQSSNPAILKSGNPLVLLFENPEITAVLLLFYLSYI